VVFEEEEEGALGAATNELKLEEGASAFERSLHKPMKRDNIRPKVYLL
jgi:hypothetical protein